MHNNNLVLSISILFKIKLDLDLFSNEINSYFSLRIQADVEQLSELISMCPYRNADYFLFLSIDIYILFYREQFNQ